jgi:hypothetical protein
MLLISSFHSTSVVYNTVYPLETKDQNQPKIHWNFIPILFHSQYSFETSISQEQWCMNSYLSSELQIIFIRHVLLQNFIFLYLEMDIADIPILNILLTCGIFGCSYRNSFDQYPMNLKTARKTQSAWSRINNFRSIVEITEFCYIKVHMIFKWKTYLWSKYLIRIQ